MTRQPNTTAATLHLSLENTEKSEVIEHLREWCTADEDRPSGATVKEGTGLWFPEDEEKHEVEDNLLIEIWTDNERELEEVRDLKDELETVYDQYCVCLSVEEKYYEH